MRQILKEKNSQRVFKDMGMNKWREIPVEKLRRGDRIRLYTPAGRPLELGGDETLTVQSDAFLRDDHWMIEVKGTAS